MANMFRFANTLQNLRDCYEHWDGELIESEEKARSKLLELCQLISYDCDDVNDPKRIAELTRQSGDMDKAIKLYNQAWEKARKERI